MALQNRRRFLAQASALSATAVATVPILRAAGANERVGLGLIGCGGRGSGVIQEFARLPNVDIAYVCDPDEGRAADAVKKLSNQPRPVGDLRRILDDRQVDAVVIATPDHWHAPAAILAAAAGKHVYVEKPCSHNLREGTALVAAARRHRRVVQHGTQSRSDGLIAYAIAQLQAGVIGDVLSAKAWNVQRRAPIGRSQPSNPPPGLDYDMWIGPAPMVPFRANCFHYNWHWWYAFGTGDMGNDGVHELDIARWGLGVQSLPHRVAAFGGKYAYDDDQQFPDTQYAVFEYDQPSEPAISRQLIFEMRLWSRYGLEGVDNGNAFYGRTGWMLLSKRGILKVFDERNQPIPVKLERLDITNHFQNFVDAVRGTAEPRAEIEIGHHSAALCHLGNIAARVRRSLQVDPPTETIVGDPEAAGLLGRTYRTGHWAAI